MICNIAQIFGILGLIVMIYSLFQKNKDKMLWFVVLNGLFFGCQYFLLQAYSGMFSNFFGIFRTYICREKEKKESLNKWYVFVFFMIGYIVIGIITFDGHIISLLPIIAELIYVITLWQKSVRRIRYGTLLMVILWLIYDVVVKAYPSMIADLIVMTSTIIAIGVNDLKKKGMEKMKNTVDIISKRLILRKIKADDYKAIYECWTSDFEVSKYVTWNPHSSSDETKKLVNFWLNEYNQEHTYRWIVEKKETHEIMGMIDVINKNLQYMTAEVGYCYGSKYWGNGYASEALTEVINYLHNIGFMTVYAQHFESNKASGKVMQNAGMKYEGTLKSRVINKLGNREDVCVYSSVKD